MSAYIHEILGTGFYKTRNGELILIYEKTPKKLYNWKGIFLTRMLTGYKQPSECWMTSGNALIGGECSGDDILHLIKLIDLEKMKLASPSVAGQKK